jgi:phosphatidate cytidylyltransferase
MLKQRIITAAILAAVFFSALFGLSPRTFSWFCLLLLAGGAFEWARLAGFARAPAVLYAIVLVAIALGWSLAVPDAAGTRAVTGIEAVAGVFWVFIAPPWIARGWPTRRKALMAPLGAVLFLGIWFALVELQGRSAWLLLAVMAIVWLADTGAYFTGRRFGKRKLAPLVSPGKSWEGVIGGLACVGIYALIVVALSTTMRAHGAAVVAASLALAAISVVGDLFESWLKRQAGVKDSGALLPGHGGVLDRIDALMPVLPLATLLVEGMS